MPNQLTLRPADECRYDALALGEVMLRLDPGELRIRTARSFTAWEGGGEYNVVRGLSRVFGQRAGVITALVDDEVGHLIEGFIMAGGVDTSLIHWAPSDGVGRTVRNGLNFTERGFGVRGAKGVNDRGHTAIAQLGPDEVDFEAIFSQGVRWLHTGGIFAALSETSAATALAAMKAAKKYGTIVSYDLNYRPSLWKSIGGQQRAQQVNRELAQYVDVMLGNEEDFTACLGFEVEGVDEHVRGIDVSNFKKMIATAVKEFPNFKATATTLREVHTATVNDWAAICWHDGNFYESNAYPNLEILDRVGGGDSFASGLVYGFLESNDPEKAVQYGAAHGALAMTTPGDTTMASLSEVKKVVSGGGARVVR